MNWRATLKTNALSIAIGSFPEERETQEPPTISPDGSSPSVDR
jgi:hypothetical protein